MPMLTELHRQHNQQSALRNLGKLGLLMFGLGAGARGMQGLTGLGRRNLSKAKPANPFLRPTVEIPVKREEEKYAEDSSWHSAVTGPFADAFSGNVSNPLAQPWVLPAAALGGPLATYAGWQLTDKVMDARRKNELRARLDQAKEDYTRALQGETKLAKDLDQLFEMSKEAGLFSSDTAGYLSGAGLTAGGLLALGSGLLAHDLSKGRRPEEILSAAKTRRDRERMRRSPPPVFARAGNVPDEDELEGEPLDKTAGKWDGRLKKLHARRNPEEKVAAAVTNISKDPVQAPRPTAPPTPPSPPPAPPTRPK